MSEDNKISKKKNSIQTKKYFLKIINAYFELVIEV